MTPGFPRFPDEGFDVTAQGVLSINLANSLSILTHSFNKYILSNHSMQDIALGTGDPAKTKTKETMARPL